MITFGKHVFLILALLYDLNAIRNHYKFLIKGYGASSIPLISLLVYFFYISTTSSINGDMTLCWWFLLGYHFACHFIIPFFLSLIYDTDKNLEKEELGIIHQERMISSYIEYAKDKWHGRKNRIRNAEYLAMKWAEFNRFDMSVYSELPEESQDALIQRLKILKPELIPLQLK